MVPKGTFSPSGFSPTAATASAEHLRWGLWGRKGKTLPHSETRWAGLAAMGTDVPLVQRRSDSQCTCCWKFPWLGTQVEVPEPLWLQ